MLTFCLSPSWGQRVGLRERAGGGSGGLGRSRKGELDHKGEQGDSMKAVMTVMFLFPQRSFRYADCALTLGKCIWFFSCFPYDNGFFRADS